MTWTAYDDGYLRAHQWVQALAGGAALPSEASPVALGPGEIAHARLAPVSVSGHFGESGQYRRSFLLVGGPVGLALTGAASLAHNASKKAEAQRAAVPRWHPLGNATVVATNQRLVAIIGAKLESFPYAETGPLQLLVGPGGAPVVQFQPSGMPLMRLGSPWTPLLYVFVHHLIDGRPPGLPLPPGFLERAQAEGRLAAG